MRRPGLGHLGVLLLALAALLPSLAAAGTPAEPEVTDGSGDVPPGMEWADVRKAWFTREGDSFTLTILVVGLEPPSAGEVGVAFDSGGVHLIAGYSIIPGSYAGGFLGFADDTGHALAGSTPTQMPGAFEAGLAMVSFTRADLPGGAGDFSDPWAWSESRDSSGHTARLDRTSVGGTFAWADPLRPGGLSSGSGGSGADVAANRSAGGGERASPLPVPVALLGVAVGALAAARRR